MVSLLLATVLATAPLDPQRAALLEVLQHGGDSAGCQPAQTRAAALSATFRRLGSLAGGEVVLAEVESPCICGAQNCPYYVLRLDRGAPKLLYATFGISLSTVLAVPLPTLIVAAHDSALVTDETTVAWRNGRYVEASSARIRGDTGARKPNAIPVRFAPGGSSVVLHGTASIGWYDSYAFAATRGQELTISAVRARAPVSILVFLADGSTNAEVVPGKPYTLPKTGSYRVQIEIAADKDQPYSLTLEIR